MQNVLPPPFVLHGKELRQVALPHAEAPKVGQKNWLLLHVVLPVKLLANHPEP